MPPCLPPLSHDGAILSAAFTPRHAVVAADDAGARVLRRYRGGAQEIDIIMRGGEEARYALRARYAMARRYARSAAAA